jgi:V/A-type H+-transporting ATPase subunit C
LSETHAYEVARVRAREPSLISEGEMQKLSQCGSYEECLQFLSNKHWNIEFGADYESMLNQEIEKTWDFVLELAQPKENLGVFLCQNDYHNLKAAIKTCSYESSPKNLFLPRGLVETENILKSAKQNDFSLLPKYMQSAAKEAMEVFLHTGDGQLSDIILDRDTLKTINKFSEISDCLAIKKYANLIISVTNIKIAERCRSAQKSKDFLKRAIYPSESINIDDLISNYINEDKFYSYISLTEYSESVPFLKKSISDFEDWFDNMILEEMKVEKYNPFTLGPVVSYLLHRLHEIKSVKKIIVSIKNSSSKNNFKHLEKYNLENNETASLCNISKDLDVFSKVAIVGDIESIYGFGTLGIEVFAIKNKQEALKKIKTLSLSEYAIIYITESLAFEIYDDLRPYRENLLPAIIPIPGIDGRASLGRKHIKGLIIKAIGSDI